MLFELNIDLGKPESLAQRAITQTHTGYFQIGPMTQDLIWEQYPYPVTLKNLLTGNSNNMAYENNDAIALNPPLAPQAEVWMNKTGSTSGFGGYIAVIPVKKQAVVILANKNYPNSDRIELFAAGIILDGNDCGRYPVFRGKNQSLGIGPVTDHGGNTGWPLSAAPPWC